MGIKKIFSIFKKGSKVAAKTQKGKKGEGGMKWPSGTRIGVYGHTNSGKTVYFTVLNEESKISSDIQISVIDNPTSAEFLANRRAIWGLGTTTSEGTMVDLRGEKKFPEPTEEDRVLLFNAILDRKKTISVVTYDYPGKAVSISDSSQVREKVADFMRGCDGLLFFFDPKTLASELQCQSHVASFVNMLEQIAPLSGHLPIPVGLVVTKADILAGFSGEDQTVLIRPEVENLLSENFDVFLEKVLADSRITSNSDWAASVRNVLVKVREFLKVIVGRTLNFQIFFTSNTGDQPQKIATDVGRSIYAPPEKIHPVGVREPFCWVLKSVIRNRRVCRMRSFTKFVAILSVIWMLIYSVPFLINFSYLLPGVTDKEDTILKKHKGSFYTLPKSNIDEIVRSYRRYSVSKTVRWFFPNFTLAAKAVANKYKAANVGNALKDLEVTIGRFADLVSDSTRWPGAKVDDTIFIDNAEKEQFREIGGTMKSYMDAAEKNSELFLRSERGYWYWSKFREALFSPGDTALWGLIKKRVEQDKKSSTLKLSKSEKHMHTAFGKQKVQTERIVVAREASNELDDLAKEINNNDDPQYRLNSAVRKLRNLKDKLLSNPSKSAEVARIDKYLEKAAYFNRRRKYTYTASNVPQDHHLHIAVKRKRKDILWPLEQIHKGKSYTIEWKAGDEFWVALDPKLVTGGSPETWGKNPTESLKLDKKYSLFQLDGNITFNSGLKATIDFEDDIWSKIPEFE